MSDILKINNLHVSYGPIQALRGVNLSVPKGKIIAILGANGAGKSTLLKTISGLVPTLEGSIHFEEKDITKEAAERITEMGISHVPEGRSIFGDLTVYENLLVGAFTVKPSKVRWSNMPEEAKSKKLITKYKDKIGSNEDFELMLNKKEMIGYNLGQVYAFFPVLKDRYKQIASTLSGGEMQMLAIARALMGSPKLLVLDEPSLGLAPLIVRSIFEKVKLLNKLGISVLIVEQNALQTLKIADYAYVLQLGKVVREDNAETLITDQDLIKAYLG